MSDTSSAEGPSVPERSNVQIPDIAQSEGAKRSQRGMRIVLLSALSVVVLIAVTAVAGITVISHAVGALPRIHAANLAAAGAPLSRSSLRGENVLLVGHVHLPGGEERPSGLIMLLHYGFQRRAGDTVSFNPFVRVPVPGHGRMQLENTLVAGGTPLLIRTVRRLTGLRIDNYARIDLPHVTALADTIGGVTVPTTSGPQHLDGATVVNFVRDPAVGEETRVLRQAALVRAVVRKVASRHLLLRPAVLRATIAMLRDDSNFSLARLDLLDHDIRLLGSRNASFAIDPFARANGMVFPSPLSRSLWLAVRHDAVRSWLMEHPLWQIPRVIP